MDRSSVLVLSVGLAAIPAAGQTFQSEELRPFPWQNRSYAYGINDAGTVVGQIGEVGGLFPAARWVGTEVEDLGSLGYPYALAHDINNADQIVGLCYASSGTGIPFVYESGIMAPLALPPGYVGGEALQIDDQGRITGSVYESGGSLPGRPCLWEKLGGAWQPAVLSVGNHPGGAAVAINSAGAIVGYVQEASPPFLGATWIGGVLSTPPLGPIGSGSGLWDIDDAGRMVGGYVPQVGVGTSVLQDGIVLTDLGHLPGYAHTFAYRIGSSGTIVGHVYNGNPYAALGAFIDCRAVVWRGGTLASVNSLLAPSDGAMDVRQVWDINSRGQLAGLGAVNGLPNYVAVRLTPCYPNCDNSTTAPVLNVLDFNCFLNRFSAGNTYANCDGSTAAPVLNVLDFNCFLNSFAAGCQAP